MDFSAKRMATAMLVAALSGTTAVQAHTISITGTVRDFTPSHPDFESGISGVVTGLVSPTLGADNTPVYVGPPGAGAIDSAASFAQWYHNVPGVNLSRPITLTLDNGAAAPGGVYTFDSSAFFPINGELFNAGVPGLNYHFTVELHGTFQYSGGPLTLGFSGDDDVWVFINKQLVIDLGGVHGTASDTLTEAELAALGLVAGQTYAFDFFFAERHTTGSNLFLSTSALLSPNVIPEPGSAALLALGLFGMLGWRKRKGSSSRART